MNLLRSAVHMLWMILWVIPVAIVMVAVAPFTPKPGMYKYARFFLLTAVHGLRVICGVNWRITGYENLPIGATSPAILLVKHQSTLETFLMPVIMPHPLAYVFKKELLYVPFFGWGIGLLDMIHIDRSRRTEAFSKVVAQGKALLDKGVWVIMFPEGTRIARGQQGVYKSGGTRLAVATGAPVIPIAVSSARCWPRRAFIKHPGTIDVVIGKPIPSDGREPDELMREVETWIEARMREIDPQAYPSSPSPVPASGSGPSQAQA